MACYRLHDEYWAVNLESVGLDTSSNTETSKPCIILKHGLVVHKFSILLPYILQWTFILNRAMDRIPVTLRSEVPIFLIKHENVSYLYFNSRYKKLSIHLKVFVSRYPGKFHKNLTLQGGVD